MRAVSHVRVVSQLYTIRRDEYLQTYVWMSQYFSRGNLHTWARSASPEGMNNVNVLIPCRWGGTVGLDLQLSRFCKGGHWRDKKHYPISAGSASFLASSPIWLKTQLEASGGGCTPLCTWVWPCTSSAKHSAAFVDGRLSQSLAVNIPVSHKEPSPRNKDIETKQSDRAWRRMRLLLVNLLQAIWTVKTQSGARHAAFWKVTWKKEEGTLFEL